MLVCNTIIQTTNTTQWWDGTTWREAGSGVSSVNTASPVSGDGSVGTPITIASGAITNTYLATNSVDSTKVLNGNITSSKIQDGSIVAADLAPTGVTAEHLIMLLLTTKDRLLMDQMFLT